MTSRQLSLYTLGSIFFKCSSLAGIWSCHVVTQTLKLNTDKGYRRDNYIFELSYLGMLVTNLELIKKHLYLCRGCWRHPRKRFDTVLSPSF